VRAGCSGNRLNVHSTVANLGDQEDNPSSPFQVERIQLRQRIDDEVPSEGALASIWRRPPSP
jgi:hypothetical protein